MHGRGAIAMTWIREDLWHIEADLVMRRPEDGGRRAPAWTGYLPNWWLPGEDAPVIASAMLELVDDAKLAAGDSGRVRISPFAPELWVHVKIGSTLEMCEGQTRFGEATVTGIVRPQTPIAQAIEPEPAQR